MQNQKLLDEILSIIKSVRDEEESLVKIHTFLVNEIYIKPEEEPIPEKYAAMVPNIAGCIDGGVVCFVNSDSLEVEEVPEFNLKLDPDEYEFLTGEKKGPFKYESWDNYFEFEPPPSHEGYKIMAAFAENLLDDRWQSKLINALNKRRPFANFKHLVDNSPYRQQWFDFKRVYLERQVYNQLMYYIENNEDE